jgi:hypothetical protein
MVAIVRLYTLMLVNYCNMQIQFDVEISNTKTLIGFTVSNECYGVRDLDTKLYLHIVVIYQLKCVQPDDGHHGGPKHVVVARLTSLAINV